MSSKDWMDARLGDVIEFNPRESIKKGSPSKKIGMDKLNTFQRKIEGYEVTSFSGGSKFRNGDTLLARITPCLENGKTAQVTILEKDEVAFGSTEFIVFREKEGCTDNDFIFYLSLSAFIRDTAIKSMTGTSGRQRAQTDVIQNTKIKLPSLAEQKAIAHVLSTLDDKIEVNNRINKTLEDMAQAIFKRWFVDFEFPNEDGEPYKSSGGEMVESGLGMIPKGWRVKPLGKLIEIHDSKRVPLSSNQREYMEKKFPYYGAASLMDYVDDFLFDGTYVLLGEDGTVIKDDGSAVLQFVWGKFWVNNHAHVISGKSNISINFIYALLKSIKVSEAVTGAVQKKINQKNLTSIKVIVPDATTLIGDFSKIIEASFDLFKNLSDENKNLTKLRDELLPKLMSGEIRVPIEES